MQGFYPDGQGTEGGTPNGIGSREKTNMDTQEGGRNVVRPPALSFEEWQRELEIREEDAQDERDTYFCAFGPTIQ